MTAFLKPCELLGVVNPSPAEKKRVREARWAMDKGRCVERDLYWSMHLMHVKSKGAGGAFTTANTLTGCARCHAKRHAGGKPVPAK